MHLLQELKDAGFDMPQMKHKVKCKAFEDNVSAIEMATEKMLNKEYLRHGEAVGLGILCELYYSNGKEYVINQDLNEISKDRDLGEIEEKIEKILNEKIRPAVAKDGGDIKFIEFNNGIVKVQLQGSCSGCPSSTMTLKQGVQNLLKHYLPEVKEVEAV